MRVEGVEEVEANLDIASQKSLNCKLNDPSTPSTPKPSTAGTLQFNPSLSLTW
jgi:hypothetical protein